MSESKRFVAGICMNPYDEALLWCRDAYGQFEIPGGRLLEREVPLQGLARHFKSKLDLEIRAVHPIGTVNFMQDDTIYPADIFQITECRGTPSFTEDLLYTDLKEAAIHRRNELRRLKRVSPLIEAYVEAYANNELTDLRLQYAPTIESR